MSERVISGFKTLVLDANLQLKIENLKCSVSKSVPDLFKGFQKFTEATTTLQDVLNKGTRQNLSSLYGGRIPHTPPDIIRKFL